MIKKLAILIITILSLSMMLVGCKSETPTDVVNAYFEQLKNGDSEQANEFIESAMFQEDEETSELPDNSDDEIVEDTQNPDNNEDSYPITDSI